jgi:hypothetical protein
LNDQRKRKWEKKRYKARSSSILAEKWGVCFGTDSKTDDSFPTHQITPNDITQSRLQRVSKRQKPRELTIDPDISANFSTEELNMAHLLAVKSGKAAS